jgi:hypothetical protein
VVFVEPDAIVDFRRGAGGRLQGAEVVDQSHGFRGWKV